MAMPGGPLSTPSGPDPLDDEWERFQANGCPDWWLLAKYVSQAARSFPYVPRGLSAIPGSIALDAQDSRRDAASDPGMVGPAPSGVDLQQKHSKGAAQAATSASPGASAAHSKQTALTSQPSSDVAAESSLQSPAAMPDALPTSAYRSTAGPSSAAAPAACGLKGIFGCSGGCTPPCSAAPPADQTA